MPSAERDIANLPAKDSIKAFELIRSLVGKKNEQEVAALVKAKFGGDISGQSIIAAFRRAEKKASGALKPAGGKRHGLSDEQHAKILAEAKAQLSASKGKILQLAPLSQLMKSRHGINASPVTIKNLLDAKMAEGKFARDTGFSFARTKPGRPQRINYTAMNKALRKKLGENQFGFRSHQMGKFPKL